MIEFLLKASFALGVVFSFYKLVLQQESFFAVNRFYLVGSLALVFALPFVSLPQLMPHQGYLTAVWEKREDTATSKATPAATAQRIRLAGTALQKTVAPELQPTTRKVEASPKVPEQPASAQGLSGWFWLGLLYLFGVLIFTLSFLFQLGTIVYKVRTAPDKIADGEVVIVNTTRRQAPCSFFKYIFIYPDDYDFETYEQIIAHQQGIFHGRSGNGERLDDQPVNQGSHNYGEQDRIKPFAKGTFRCTVAAWSPQPVSKPASGRRGRLRSRHCK